MSKQPFFEGWYFKHQQGGHTVAFIPAHHRDESGARTASLQIVTEDRAEYREIPIREFRVEREPFRVWCGNSLFSLGGCRIDCPFAGRRLTGTLRYGPWTVPRGDIMGPFRFVPFMQCRHSVLSMTHSVDGTLTLDGQALDFRRGQGYVEGDRGMSFPSRYLWTQSLFPGGSVMLSVADVPFCGGHFTGCVGFVWLNGREVRLATYRGLRIVEAGPWGAVVRQGRWELTVELLEARPLDLRAPQLGDMGRTIRESAACRVRYRLLRDGKRVLDLECGQAGFEADWPEN